jgi:hypothetical protein
MTSDSPQQQACVACAQRKSPDHFVDVEEDIVVDFHEEEVRLGAVLIEQLQHIHRLDGQIVVGVDEAFLDRVAVPDVFHFELVLKRKLKDH